MMSASRWILASGLLVLGLVPGALADSNLDPAEWVQVRNDPSEPIHVSAETQSGGYVSTSGGTPGPTMPPVNACRVVCVWIESQRLGLDSDGPELIHPRLGGSTPAVRQEGVGEIYEQRVVVDAGVPNAIRDTRVELVHAGASADVARPCADCTGTLQAWDGSVSAPTPGFPGGSEVLITLTTPEGRHALARVVLA